MCTNDVSDGALNYCKLPLFPFLLRTDAWQLCCWGFVLQSLLQEQGSVVVGSEPFTPSLFSVFLLAVFALDFNTASSSSMVYFTLCKRCTLNSLLALLMYFIFSGRFTQMFSYGLEYNSYLTDRELHQISRICSSKKFLLWSVAECWWRLGL